MVIRPVAQGNPLFLERLKPFVVNVQPSACGILRHIVPEDVTHVVEELWETLGFAAEKGGMACQQSWPAYDASKTVDAEVNMAVQVCGKLRGTITVPVDSGEEAVVAAALADPKEIGRASCRERV